jgi:uncharacterized protein YggE
MILEIVMSASRFAALRMACLIVGFAVAAEAPVQAQQQQLTPPGTQGHIVVIGEGSVSAVPDYAQTIGGVTTQGKSVQEATAANSKIMAAITAALVGAGVAQKDIQTSRFWVQPEYNTSSPPKISGYEVSNQATVKIRDLNKAGDIIERIVGAGATNIGNIQFEHNDPSKLLDQAREAAVADAKHKAEVYAKASGVTLGRVAWLTEDAGYTPPMPMFAARAAAGAAAPVPIATGEDALHVRITVGFDIGN